MTARRIQAPPAAKPGRPRSEQARKAILQSAYALLKERGPARVTVEEVAARAGVGKPTIYRYWANAQELAMAAAMERSPAEVKVAETGSALEDLRQHVRAIIGRFSSRHGRPLALMLASAEQDSELFKAFRNRVVLQGRNEGKAILKRAATMGEIREDAPLETAVDLIYGSIFFRLIAHHAPLNEAFGDSVVDIALRGLERTTKQP
jgi:AcrR family transcriptional regulator